MNAESGENDRNVNAAVSETSVTWGPETLVGLLLGFWALWWTLVAATNAFDGLVALGVLGDGWPFASGNYDALRSIVAVHGTPEEIAAALFAGGVAWESAVAILTWRAFVDARRRTASKRSIYRAFVPAVGFFAAFLVLTEAFLAYDLAQSIAGLFVAALLSLFVLDRFVRSTDADEADVDQAADVEDTRDAA